MSSLVRVWRKCDFGVRSVHSVESSVSGWVRERFIEADWEKFGDGGILWLAMIQGEDVECSLN